MKFSDMCKSYQNKSKLPYVDFYDVLKAYYDILREAKGFCSDGDRTRDLSPINLPDGSDV